MAFPTVAATNTSQNSTVATSNNVALPASISAGDLLILFFGCTSSSGGDTPSGWSALVTGNRLCVFYKVADGTEGATVTVNHTGSISARHASISYRITGYSGTPEATTLASSYNVPTLSPSWGALDTLWLAAAVASASDYTFNAAPTNYTNLIDVGNASSSATSRMRAASARRDLNASSDDPDSFGVSGGSASSPLSVLVAVRPAGGAATTPRMTLLGVG